MRRPIFGILWVESEGLENGGQGIDVLAGEDLDAPEGGALVADVAARALPDESSSFAGAGQGAHEEGRVAGGEGGAWWGSGRRRRAWSSPATPLALGTEKSVSLGMCS